MPGHDLGNGYYMSNALEWLKKQYNFRYEVKDEATGTDISEGMLMSTITSGLSLAAVEFIIWFFIMRNNPSESKQLLFWYVLNPLGLNICVVFLVWLIYMRIRAIKAGSGRSTWLYELIISGLYMLAYCGDYFFLRKFDMSFLLLVMPLVMLVLRRNRNYPIALVFLTVIYIFAQLAPAGIPGEPGYQISVVANTVFGIWVLTSMMYLLILTRDSTAYSYRKKEEEELKQNAFREQISRVGHDIHTPIHSIEGLSEMILRNNISERTGRDIVVIREATEDILATLDKTLESSRIELSGIENQQAEGDADGAGTEDEKSGTYLFAPKAHVLVVDDSILNLNVIRALLARTQIKLDCALSGQEALKMVSYNYYDVIILDHMMPDMDGIETLHNIKLNPGANEDTPVIAITANDISGARGMYKHEGFAACVAKPISGDELEAVLERFLPPHIVSRRDL